MENRTAQNSAPCQVDSGQITICGAVFFD